MQRSRRGSFILVFVLVVVAVVMVLAYTGRFQLGQNIRMIDQVDVQRRVTLAAQSAIEETCARLESMPAFRRFPIPRDGAASPDLKDRLPLPQDVPVPLTAKDLEPLGVTVTPVQVSCSPWVQRSWDVQASYRLHRSISVFEFRLSVSCRSANGTLDRSIVARRFAESSPDMDGSTCRIKIQAHDLFFSVR